MQQQVDQLVPPAHSLSQNEQALEERKSSSSESQQSRSRSRSPPQRIEGEPRLGDSFSQSKNEEIVRNGNGSSMENENKDRGKLKKRGSRAPGTKEQKAKKKRPTKQLLTDFSEYLPESLLVVSRTNITSKIRIGERFQAEIPSAPPYLTLNRPLDQWQIWEGSSNPQYRPTEQNLRRFKQILGGNRNEEELIAMRQRLGVKSWSRVLQWAEGRRTELRWTFHQLQRGRPS